MKGHLGKNWRVIYPTFPRVYHMGGECGYHTKLHTCNFNAVQKSLDDQLATRKHLYFPENLKFTNIGGKFPIKFKGMMDLRYQSQIKIKVMVVGEMFVIGVYVNDTLICSVTSTRSPLENRLNIRPGSTPEAKRRLSGRTAQKYSAAER